MEAENIKLNRLHYTLFIICVAFSMVTVSATSEMSNINDGKSVNDTSSKSNNVKNSVSINNTDTTLYNLSLGDNGTKVASLQKTLYKYGYYSGEIDGEFGPYTEQAVKLLQIDAGLNPDGYVGNLTSSVIDQLNTLLENDSQGVIGNSKKTNQGSSSNNDEYSSKSYSSSNSGEYSSNSYSNANSYGNSRSSGSSLYGGYGKGVGDCWDNSEMLYQKLKSQGNDVRIIQYPTSLSSNHRSVQYYSNGKWVDYDYKGNGYKKVYYATSNKNGATVVK